MSAEFYTWAIPNANMCYNSPQIKLRSQAFRMAGHTWGVQFFPLGAHPNTTGYSSIFIYLLSEPSSATPNTVKFSIQLVNSKELHVSNSPCEFIRRGQMYGFDKFVLTERVQQSINRTDNSWKFKIRIMGTEVPKPSY
jgi:hypothetical protein